MGALRTSSGWIGGGGAAQDRLLFRIPPHVNYLLFALDNLEAWCAAVMKTLNHKVYI